MIPRQHGTNNRMQQHDTATPIQQHDTVTPPTQHHHTTNTNKHTIDQQYNTHSANTGDNTHIPTASSPCCTTNPTRLCDSADTRPPRTSTWEYSTPHLPAQHPRPAFPSPPSRCGRTPRTRPTPRRSARSPTAAATRRSATPASCAASPPAAACAPPPASEAALRLISPPLLPVAVGCASRWMFTPFVCASHANSCACRKSLMSPVSSTWSARSFWVPSAFFPMPSLL